VFRPKNGKRSGHEPGYEGKESRMYIGVGTVLLIVLIIILIVFVF
jgi:hypothetical protein